MTGGLRLLNDLLGGARAACSSMQTVFPRVSPKGALAERRAASRVLAAVVFDGGLHGICGLLSRQGNVDVVRHPALG